MIYHYSDIPPEALEVQPPIGWDLPVLIAGDYDSKIMLAAMCLNIGYYIGSNERENKNELAAR